jgi:hypothetical protein
MIAGRDALLELAGQGETPPDPLDSKPPSLSPVLVVVASVVVASVVVGVEVGSLVSVVVVEVVSVGSVVEEVVVVDAVVDSVVVDDDDAGSSPPVASAITAIRSPITSAATRAIAAFCPPDMPVGSSRRSRLPRSS